MASITLRLHVEVQPELELHLERLAEACKGSIEIRERVLGLLDSVSKAGGVDSHPLVAVRTVDGRIVLEPSDLLRQLVAA